MKRRKKRQRYEPRENYIGRKFGRLTVVQLINDDGCFSSCQAICKCSCGKETRDDGSPITVNLLNLIRGMTTSCGCARTKAAHEEDGKEYYHYTNQAINRKDRLYSVWHDMYRRCSILSSPNYQHYGARGIDLCKQWRGSNGYVHFKKWAMANGYDPNAPRCQCTIDRINNNRGYYPSNC